MLIPYWRSILGIRIITLLTQREREYHGIDHFYSFLFIFEGTAYGLVGFGGSILICWSSWGSKLGSQNEHRQDTTTDTITQIGHGLKSGRHRDDVPWSMSHRASAHGKHFCISRWCGKETGRFPILSTSKYCHIINDHTFHNSHSWSHEIWAWGQVQIFRWRCCCGWYLGSVIFSVPVVHKFHTQIIPDIALGLDGSQQVCPQEYSIIWLMCKMLLFTKLNGLFELAHYGICLSLAMVMLFINLATWTIHWCVIKKTCRIEFQRSLHVQSLKHVLKPFLWNATFRSAEERSTSSRRMRSACAVWIRCPMKWSWLGPSFWKGWTNGRLSAPRRHTKKNTVFKTHPWYLVWSIFWNGTLSGSELRAFLKNTSLAGGSVAMLRQVMKGHLPSEKLEFKAIIPSCKEGDDSRFILNSSTKPEMVINCEHIQAELQTGRINIWHFMAFLPDIQAELQTGRINIWHFMA